MEQIELTDAERQLIQILRERDAREDFSITIKTEGGAWEFELSFTVKGQHRRTRGTGRTFEQAWNSDYWVD